MRFVVISLSSRSFSAALVIQAVTRVYEAEKRGDLISPNSGITKYQQAQKQKRPDIIRPFYHE
jgi:hypothetical protein